MQLGMMGLGRMGANMVRRLMQAGHHCVGFSLDTDTVRALEREGMSGAASPGDFVGKIATPRAVWLMIPAAAVDATLASLAPLLDADDTVIDGGNSYYHDDLRRARELAPRGIHYLDVGASGCVGARKRILFDDRGRRDSGSPPRPHLCGVGARCGGGGKNTRARETGWHGGAGLLALRAVGRGPLCEDGPQRRRIRPGGSVRGRLQYPSPRQRRAAPALGGR